MDPAVFAALVLPGLGTGIGGLLLLRFREPSERTLDALLGVTGGVMLAATVFGLLRPAVDRGPPVTVVGAVAAGIVVLAALDRWVPHAHARYTEGGRAAVELQETRLQPRLLLTAMTLHNVPEGLAVGASFAIGGWEVGLPIAVAIGLQNIPEGFAAAAPLLRSGTPPRRVVWIATLTGLVEPPAALIAYWAVGVVEPMLVVGLGLAAGAMLYVVFDELIPESLAHGNARAAVSSLVAGFGMMYVLEQALG